jgi:hypothetical protein
VKAFHPSEVRLLSCAMDDFGFAALPVVPEQFRHAILEYRFNRLANLTTSTKPAKAKPAIPAVSDEREQMSRRLAIATL